MKILLLVIGFIIMYNTQDFLSTGDAYKIVHVDHFEKKDVNEQELRNVCIGKIIELVRIPGEEDRGNVINLGGRGFVTKYCGSIIRWDGGLYQSDWRDRLENKYILNNSRMELFENCSYSGRRGTIHITDGYCNSVCKFRVKKVSKADVKLKYGANQLIDIEDVLRVLNRPTHIFN